MGSTVPLGTVPLVVIGIAAIVVKLGHISLIFQDISMKLGGHMGHGPNSSYHHVMTSYDMLSLKYDRKCREKMDKLMYEL